MFDWCPHRMESLPDAIVQCIFSHMNNAKDVAICNCVSKRWKESLPFIKSLFFPRNSFDNHDGSDHPDTIVCKMISSIVKLEELVVYSPFSSAGLASWLLLVSSSLKHLELRLDNLTEYQSCIESPSKLDCISAAKNLESLKLWGVLMVKSPKWDAFPKLQSLEIVGARLEDPALTAALQACPNLKNLLLLGCEGVRSVSLELLNLEQCKLDFYGGGNYSLTLTSPKIEFLEVQGCSWISVRETTRLRNLSISNNAGNIWFSIQLFVQQVWNAIYTSNFILPFLPVETTWWLVLIWCNCFSPLVICCRESIHGRFWKTGGSGVPVYQGSPMVLECNK